MIPYKYPNGRSVEWGKISEERDLINKTKYKVFYNYFCRISMENLIQIKFLDKILNL